MLDHFSSLKSLNTTDLSLLDKFLCVITKKDSYYMINKHSLNASKIKLSLLTSIVKTLSYLGDRNFKDVDVHWSILKLFFICLKEDATITEIPLKIRLRKFFECKRFANESEINTYSIHCSLILNMLIFDNDLKTNSSINITLLRLFLNEALPCLCYNGKSQVALEFLRTISVSLPDIYVQILTSRLVTEV